jgi:23S rRNA pseudouridine955/2504/2580 synthase
MSGIKHIRVAPDEGGVRLDRWFSRHIPDVPHSRLQKLLRSGQIRVDGKRIKAGFRLIEGQEIRVPPLGQKSDGEKKPAQPAAAASMIEALLASVLYRDDHLIALNKPPGLAVQGGSGIKTHLDMMLDALRFDADERPRLVHRLDKDTSGVILLGRTVSAAARLGTLFRTHQARKLYWAAVVGVPTPDEGSVDLPMAKMAGAKGERMGEAKGGKSALTHYRTLDRAGSKASWLALEPLSGRTHQLRVHCTAMGTPILGDGKYGGRKAFLEGKGVAKKMHLHARAIRLPHEKRGVLEIIAPLPVHMKETWRFLGFCEEQAQAGFSSNSKDKGDGS